MHTFGYTLERDPFGAVHKMANLPSGQPFIPPGWCPVDNDVRSAGLSSDCEEVTV